MKLHILHLSFLTLVVTTFMPTQSFEKTTYAFSKDPIDVVIPCHKKDSIALNRAIASVRKCVKGLRRIIVVSAEPFTDQAEWFDEAQFPFTKRSIIYEITPSETIAENLLKITRIVGWIYQQFLKLYAPLCIPGISSNVLIVDADMIFLKPVSFIQENGAGLYAVGTEFYPPYFDHAKRLLPDLVKLYRQHSGITHHMLFQRPVLLDFFDHIRARHGVEPWVAIARAIRLTPQNTFIHSCLSEYEMYFNFAFARTDQLKIRPLKWKNINHPNLIAKFARDGYDFVALHIYKE